MECENCKYYDADEDTCRAFVCDELYCGVLPCEERGQNDD